MNITSAISKYSASTIDSIFVDNIDLVSSKMNKGIGDLDSTINKIQESIEWWEECLKFTGGAIRPDKSFAYIIDFKFK